MNVQVGDTIGPWRNPAVDPARMKTMALLLRDPNPIHFDVATVQALGMGDAPVNQGPINVGFIMTMLGEWAGGLERVRRVRVRFFGNVFGGDAVVAGGTVRSITSGQAGSPGRVAECDVWLDADGRGRVVEGTAIVDIDGGGQIA